MREFFGGSPPDYDPHEHRNIKAPTNNFETLMHIVKCSLGTGILAMPQAYTNSGLITGLISTAVIGVIITHCLHILVRSQYFLCKRMRVPLITYPRTMVEAIELGPSNLRRFSRCSEILVDVFLIVYQVGIGCVYLLFIAKNVKKLVDPSYEMSIELHCLITLGPLMVVNCIPNLKILAPFSLLANILTFIGLGVILYFLFTLERLSDAVDYWGSYKTFPLFFGTVLFALTAVGVVLSIENNMKNPKSFGTFCGILNIGMALVTGSYMLIGAMGNLYCGKACSDSIALNMPEESTLTKIMLAMFIIAIFISYALHCSVPVEILWYQYLKPRLDRAGSTRLCVWEYALRIAICICTFVFAVLVPQLGLIISLFGALCLSALGIMFPAFIEICINMPHPPVIRILGKDIVLIIIGICGLVVGVSVTVIALIKTRS